ncbi:hypothetical protein QP580_06600, partial [Prevotella bivia]|nr:hypothetical protein [Prevotella bivia]
TKIAQTRAKEACLLFAECSLSSTKIKINNDKINERKELITIYKNLVFTVCYFKRIYIILQT